MKRSVAAQQIQLDGRDIRLLLSPKWVRVMVGGEFIADSRRARLLLAGGPPSYFFPEEDVRMDLLERTSGTLAFPFLGDAELWNIKVGDQLIPESAWSFPAPISPNFDLTGLFAFQWNKMDAWFEESQEIFVHPHDPYHRIDVLESSRHIEVTVGGIAVAHSQNPVLLFETGLPTRYYLRKLDISTELLIPSETITRCAYKGEAKHYSVRINGKVYPDMAWSYRYTTTETSKIAAMIAFYNERVDAIYVDGTLEEKPRTPWST